MEDFENKEEDLNSDFIDEWEFIILTDQNNKKQNPFQGSAREIEVS